MILKMRMAMKRSEMIDYIKSELEEFIERYNQSEGNPKRQVHRVRSAADGILAMVEGLGMKPPEIPDPDWKTHHPENSFLNEWENE